MYLALEGGPPSFKQDFSCPALLRNKLHRLIVLKYGAFTLSGRPSQYRSYNNKFSITVQEHLHTLTIYPATPHIQRCKSYIYKGLGSSPFARRYSGNLNVDFFSSRYLDGSVPWVFLNTPMCSVHCTHH